MKAIIIGVCVSFTLVVVIAATGAIASTHSGGHHSAPREPRRQSETNHQIMVPHTWCVEHPQACRIVRRR
jgi:hypothetical protein